MRILKLCKVIKGIFLLKRLKIVRKLFHLFLYNFIFLRTDIYLYYQKCQLQEIKAIIYRFNFVSLQILVKSEIYNKDIREIIGEKFI